MSVDKVTLYHGTTQECVELIQKKGLLPRNETRKKSNWAGKLKSRNNLCYLTDAYPVYYALNGVNNNEKKQDLSIIEVEVSAKSLYPDEDFVYYCSRLSGSNIKHLRIGECDPKKYKNLANLSLKYNGTVSIDRVDVDSIINVKHIKNTDYELILAIGGDANICSQSYLIFGKHYRKCVELFMTMGREESLKFAKSNWMNLVE